jgi:hypothetical protein
MGMAEQQEGAAAPSGPAAARPLPPLFDKDNDNDNDDSDDVSKYL